MYLVEDALDVLQEHRGIWEGGRVLNISSVRITGKLEMSGVSLVSF